MLAGAPARIRTADLLITNQLLYQLSYKGITFNTTLKFLREKNFWVYGFDAKSEKNFTEIEWRGNNILLFGSEGFGIKKHTEKYTDFLVKIEINKSIESLNISNSAAIAFHYINQQKKLS